MWYSEDVRHVLEFAIVAVTGDARVCCNASGRTDSGVHARGMVASFKTSSEASAGSILSSLNGILPEDIFVHSVEEVPEDFHARYDAKDRMYRYYVSLRPSAIGRFYHWYVKYSLNPQAMNQAASCILGEHDFTAFCRGLRDGVLALGVRRQHTTNGVVLHMRSDVHAADKLLMLQMIRGLYPDVQATFENGGSISWRSTRPHAQPDSLHPSEGWPSPLLM